MVYKPHRDKTLKRTAPGQRVPSWQVPTEPEPRWAAFGAVLVIILGQTWVAKSLSLEPVWLLPAVSAALLAASVAVYIPARTEPSRVMRYLSVSLAGVLVLADVASMVSLVHGVFAGGSKLGPAGLLLAGVVLWVVNMVVFALVFWELDGDGPEERSDGYRDFPDIVFPQQQQDQQGLAPAAWKPTFFDYLYVSLTAATAFSPTDAMPYSLRAKLVMGIESTISFAIAAMVVARAVNIAKG